MNSAILNFIMRMEDLFALTFFSIALFPSFSHAFSISSLKFALTNYFLIHISTFIELMHAANKVMWILQFHHVCNSYIIWTLKCIRGVHLDPWFCFSRLLLKRVKIFSRSFLVIAYLLVTHLLVKKNLISAAPFSC